MKITIGTRGSKLALWQAYYVEDLLRNMGVDTQIKTIETKGDKILNVSLSKIGSKGVFTEELESALSKGEIDIAVHSAKDLQSSLPDDLPVIAFSEREIVNDALVSRNTKLTLDDNITVGTSSTRRVALLKHFYPNVNIVDMRGNLQTRFRKMDEGACDAMILANAGIHRMGLNEHIALKLPIDQFVPPVGQGAVAIQSSISGCSEEKRDFVRTAINNLESETCLRTERAYLRYLDGGCSIPVFGNCTISENKLRLTCGIVSLDGQELLKEVVIGDLNTPEETGTQAAQLILEKGGDRILDNIRRNL